MTPDPVTPPLPTPAPILPPNPDIALPTSTECAGKWFLQLAAGDDRDALKAVVDKVRLASSQFQGAALYATQNDRYRIAIGCFASRREADALKDAFTSNGVMRNEPLVTLGSSLREKVY